MVTYGVAQVVSAVTPAPLSDAEPFPFETSSELYPEYGLLAGLSICHTLLPPAPTLPPVTLSPCHPASSLALALGVSLSRVCARSRSLSLSLSLSLSRSLCWDTRQLCAKSF